MWIIRSKCIWYEMWDLSEGKHSVERNFSGQRDACFLDLGCLLKLAKVVGFPCISNSWKLLVCFLGVKSKTHDYSKKRVYQYLKLHFFFHLSSRLHHTEDYVTVGACKLGVSIPPAHNGLSFCSQPSISLLERIKAMTILQILPLLAQWQASNDAQATLIIQ